MFDYFNESVNNEIDFKSLSEAEKLDAYLEILRLCIDTKSLSYLLFKQNMSMTEKMVNELSYVPDTINEKYNITTPLYQCVDIIQGFLNEFDIKINLDSLLNSEEKQVFYSNSNQCIKKGDVTSINIKNTNDIREVICFLHELIHYYNLPSSGERSDISSYLTEGISYAYQYIFIDYLMSRGFNYNELRMFIIDQLVTMKEISNNSKFIFDSYSSMGNITESYIYKDKYSFYEQLDSFFSSKYYPIEFIGASTGYYIGLYLYGKYLTDRDFKTKLNYLNNNLNNISAVEAFNLMGFSANTEENNATLEVAMDNLYYIYRGEINEQTRA